MSTVNFRALAIRVSILFALAFVPAQVLFAQNPGSTALGVVGFTLNFDENGNSFLNGGINPNPVVPVAGGGIQYWLPQQVTPGFVLVTALHDVNALSNPNGDTDLLTFSNQLNTAGNLVGVMLFESLIDDTDASVDLADVSAFHFPLPIPTINEFGVEGNNGFKWIPDPSNPVGAVYNGISDGLVPEPSTFVLGGLGLIALLFVGRRHYRGAARVTLRGRLNVGPMVLRLGAALLGLALFCAPALQAAQLINYLQVPPSGTLTSGSVFNLPNYGNVQVSVTNVTTTFFDQLNGYNQSAGPYFWGTDAQRFSVLNSTSATQSYQFTFNFQSGAPIPSDLVLAVVGLAFGTTATVSQAGSLVGEDTFPASGFYPGGPSSTTVLGGLTFSSLGNADPLNTGWALYQPSGAYTSLSLNVNQISGDGIGFTLGYLVPEPSTIALSSIAVVSLAVVTLRKKRRAWRLASTNVECFQLPLSPSGLFPLR